MERAWQGEADEGRRDGGHLACVLAGATVLCLVGAGGLLWWRQGDAVFDGMVNAVLAWCM